MTKKILILLMILAKTVFAWDFLTSEHQWIRTTDPFEIKNRIYRSQEPLSVYAKFNDNNNLIIYTIYNNEEFICNDGSVPIPENAPKRISIFKLVMAIRVAGKYEEFSTWLESSGFKELFYIAQEFTTDNEYFEIGKNMAKEALNLTDEEITAILSVAELPTK